MPNTVGSGNYSLKVTSEYELFGKWIKNRYMMEFRFNTLEEAQAYMKKLMNAREDSITVDDGAHAYSEVNPTNGYVSETEESMSGPWRTRWIYTIEET